MTGGGGGFSSSAGTLTLLCFTSRQSVAPLREIVNLFSKAFLRDATGERVVQDKAAEISLCIRLVTALQTYYMPTFITYQYAQELLKALEIEFRVRAWIGNKFRKKPASSPQIPNSPVAHILTTERRE
jgi:hypothetical protein